MKYTAQQIADYIRRPSYQAAEADETGVTYYVHLRDGELIDSYKDADETLFARVRDDDFPAPDQSRPDFGADCAAFERADSPAFMALVSDLTAQVNAALEGDC